jgi:hypothetical protein
MKLIIWAILLLSIASAYSQYYKNGDKIPVEVDKIWPKSNPSESYDYFSLPFCPPKEQVGEGFAYAITGSRKYISNYNIEFTGKKFKKNLKKKLTPNTLFCVKKQNYPKKT